MSVSVVLLLLVVAAVAGYWLGELRHRADRHLLRTVIRDAELLIGVDLRNHADLREAIARLDQAIRELLGR